MLAVIGGLWKVLLARVVTFRCRMGLYKSYVNGLTESAFHKFGTHIVPILWFSGGDCRRFRNTEQQWETVVKWLPRLRRFQGLVRERIIFQRKKYGLKL